MTDLKKQPQQILESLLKAVIDADKEQVQPIVDSSDSYNQFKQLVFRLISHWAAQQGSYGAVPDNLSLCTSCRQPVIDQL